MAVMKVTGRWVLWGATIAAGATMYLLDAIEAFPRWAIPTCRI
ncbi:MAG: hypothetical protein ACRDKG_04250 [Actinomycetota bacterium]